MPPEQEPKNKLIRDGVRLFGAGVTALGALRLNLVEVLVGLGIVWAEGKIGGRDKHFGRATASAG